MYYIWICVYTYTYIIHEHILHSTNLSLIQRQVEIIHSFENNTLICWSYYLKYEKPLLLLLWGENTQILERHSVIFISLLVVEEVITSCQGWRRDAHFPAWREELGTSPAWHEEPSALSITSQLWDGLFSYRGCVFSTGSRKAGLG